MCVCFLVCVCVGPCWNANNCESTRNRLLWCLSVRTRNCDVTRLQRKSQDTMTSALWTGAQNLHVDVSLRHCRVLTVRHTLASGLTSSATTFNRLSSCTVLVKSDVSFTSRSRNLWISFWLDWNTNKIYAQTCHATNYCVKSVSWIGHATEVT